MTPFKSLHTLESFNSTVALVDFLKHLEDVVTVLLDLLCVSLFCFFMSFRTDWMMVRSDLCVELLSDSLCKQKSHWIITINGKMNVWKCKLIFNTDTLQQKIEITDLKPFLSGENTSILIILATTVYKILVHFIENWCKFSTNITVLCNTLHCFIVSARAFYTLT